MDFWTVENGELVKYRRSGKCNACGQCCCKHTIVFQMEVGFDSGNREDDGEEDDHDWSEREGWHMFYAQGIWWYFKINEIAEDQSRCPNLNEDNLCNDFGDMEKWRPICRYWPFHPGNLEKFPGCGFSFERVEEKETGHDE